MIRRVPGTEPAPVTRRLCTEGCPFFNTERKDEKPGFSGVCERWKCYVPENGSGRRRENGRIVMFGFGGIVRCPKKEES